MNLYKKLILILGGSAAAAILIYAAAAFAGFSSHSKFIGGTVSDLQETTVKEKNQAVVTGTGIYLENRFNFYFMSLEYLLARDDSAVSGAGYFKAAGAKELDYLIIDRRGKVNYTENPVRTSRMPGLSASEYDTFLYQIRKSSGGKRRGIFAAQSYPGVVWVSISDKENDSLAVFRVSGQTLLSLLPGQDSESAISLVWKGGFIASLMSPGTPDFIRDRMELLCRQTEHSDHGRVIATNLFHDKDGSVWSVSSAHLYTWSEIPAGLHVIQGIKPSARSMQQTADIRNSFSGVYLLLLGGGLFALLLFLPIFLIAVRRLSGQISETVGFVRTILQSGDRARNLELDYSLEMQELSGTLNLLRDKLSSALSRLSRSHERELRAKKEAEESNILRSELLSAVLAQVRGPLARIDGYSKVVHQYSEGSEILQYSAEQTRLENRAMISVFRALSDLASLDAGAYKLSSYQIEPSDVIRDAVSDLTKRAAQNNIALEIRSEAHLEEPVTTSPYLLTHTVYTAAATLIRFMPPRSRFRISSFLNGNSLVFRFADQPSNHVSIARVFREYTETGVIAMPHCAVAVLNLLILKTEAEYLGAEVRIEQTDDANSMIEIILPLLGFNPAVTGVFTRPKLAADPERVATASRFHVAGIAGVSLAGRNPFQTGGTPTVLLANLNEKDSLIYRLILEKDGFIVVAAPDDSGWMDTLRNRRFDLIIFDMPEDGSRGVSMVAELRKEIPAGTILIVLTEARKVEFIGSLLDNGADYCFRKPVVTDDLLFAIQKLKSGRRDFL